MIPYRSTDKQRLAVARYAVAMSDAGLPESFVGAVMALAQEDQGVFELMELWNDSGDAEEKDRLVADLQEALDEEAEAPRTPLEKPKLAAGEIDAVGGQVLRFKKKLRQIIDQNGGVSEVARRTGIPQPSLSRMLNTASMPRRTTLYRIAKALNVPEGEIVTEWVR